MEHGVSVKALREAVHFAEHKLNIGITGKYTAVRDSYANGTSISWVRVYCLPDYVFFNHSSHVNAGVSCVSCHGRVDQMPLMWQEASLQMEWCLECHRDPAKYVRPQEQVFNIAWEPGPDHDGARLVREYQLKPSTSCSTCHR